MSTAVCAGYLPRIDEPLAARQLLALLIAETFGRDWNNYVQYVVIPHALAPYDKLSRKPGVDHE